MHAYSGLNIGATSIGHTTNAFGRTVAWLLGLKDSKFVLGYFEAAGGTMQDIVATNLFSTEVRYHRDINEARREVLGANFSTSTMVQVVALARPELLLGINAIAVIS